MEEVAWELGLPISCKNHAAGCIYTSDVTTLGHEADCEFRTVHCPVLNCYMDVAFNDIENHMKESHKDMADGKWVIFEVQTTVKSA